MKNPPRINLILVTSGFLAVLAGCRSPMDYRDAADEAAYTIIQDTRGQVSPSSEPFSIEPPSATLRRRLIELQELPIAGAASLSTTDLTPPDHWPQDIEPSPGATNTVAIPMAVDDTIRLSLTDALQVAARNSRDYQDAKETVFQAALALDLARNDYRATFAGALESAYSSDGSGDDRVEGIENSVDASASKTFSSGVSIASSLAVDLVALLTGDRDSALGLSADATISIPLLRGAGRHIARESLTQAERDVIYAIRTFEEFKRDMAVDIAEAYLGVMQSMDSAANALRNYKELVRSGERARDLAHAGRLPEIQVDQAHQDELRAYDRAKSAQQQAEDALDRFKVALGLPPDARIALDTDAFNTMIAEAEQRSQSTPALPEEQELLSTALATRLDMLTALQRVEDAQRAVVVAADALRAEISLLGSASAGSGRSLGSADQDDAKLDLDKGLLSGILSIDLPIERTRERNSFRNSLIDLEQTVRSAQDKEDSIKSAVRRELRGLEQSRESIATQSEAVRLAERRQQSTDLFLQAGRAEMRDLLEAEESLLSARNALTEAIVDYRVTELRLQRTIGALMVTDSGFTEERSLHDLAQATPLSTTNTPSGASHED